MLSFRVVSSDGHPVGVAVVSVGRPGGERPRLGRQTGPACDHQTFNPAVAAITVYKADGVE